MYDAKIDSLRNKWERDSKVSACVLCGLVHGSSCGVLMIYPFWILPNMVVLSINPFYLGVHTPSSPSLTLPL